jgi:hypothetical protein
VNVTLIFVVVFVAQFARAKFSRLRCVQSKARQGYKLASLLRTKLSQVSISSNAKPLMVMR